MEMKIIDNLKKYKLLFVHPRLFFEDTEKEQEYMPILLFVGIYLFLGKIFEFAVARLIILEKIPPGSEAEKFSVFIGLNGLLINLFLLLASIFILAAVTHIAIIFFTKQRFTKETFFPTWKAVAYASAIPAVYNIATSAIPAIGEFVNLWPEQSLLLPSIVWGPYSIAMTAFTIILSIASLVHVIIAVCAGLTRYHKITSWQATGAVLFSYISFVIFMMLILFLWQAFY